MASRRTDLRSHGTPAEGALWRMLKNKQVAGLRFRRQFSIGRYVVDFYCHEILLAIELDGQVHFTPEAQAYDERRTEFINGATGITLLRFENQVVFKHPEMIINAIEQYKEEYENKEKLSQRHNPLSQ